MSSCPKPRPLTSLCSFISTTHYRTLNCSFDCSFDVVDAPQSAIRPGHGMGATCYTGKSAVFSPIATLSAGVEGSVLGAGEAGRRPPSLHWRCFLWLALVRLEGFSTRRRRSKRTRHPREGNPRLADHLRRGNRQKDVDLIP